MILIVGISASAIGVGVFQGTFALTDNLLAASSFGIAAAALGIILLLLFLELHPGKSETIKE